MGRWDKQGISIKEFKLYFFLIGCTGVLIGIILGALL